MADTGGKKILLIEDDVFMAELLAGELARAGFNIEIGKTGKEGVDNFAKAKPDLVLLDLLLPDMHGFEVLQKIRQDPAGEKTKVIILSNLSEGRDVDEAKRLGATDYLVKVNYSIPEIVEKVRGWLGSGS